MGADFHSDKIEPIRPYVFDYVVGALWLIAVAAAIFTKTFMLTVASLLDLAATTMSHVIIPTFVTGFLLVIAGVVLPYCLNVVVKMPTLQLMNWFLKYQRKRNVSNDAEEAQRVKASAIKTIQRAAGVGSYISSNFALLYLETLQPTVAARLRAVRQEVDFRASSALPVALIAALVAGRVAGLWLVSYAAMFVAITVGVASFLTAVWSTNHALDNMYEDLAVALLVADARQRQPSAINTALPEVAPDMHEPVVTDRLDIVPKSTA